MARAGVALFYNFFIIHHTAWREEVSLSGRAGAPVIKKTPEESCKIRSERIAKDEESSLVTRRCGLRATNPTLTFTPNHGAQ